MNSLASLLVHVDASARTVIRLWLAHEVAARCSGSQPCSVRALYCTTPSFADMPLAFGAGASESVPFLQDLYARRASEARQAFERANAHRTPPMHWLERGGDPVIPTFVQSALYADLMVLGQHVPDEIESLNTPADFVASVLVTSGKPAIVVPAKGRFETLGHKVVLAWKPTPEAARAAAAALPLLERAERIHLVSDTSCGNELEAWLGEHGVQSRIDRHVCVDSESAGERLLSLAADVDADLLVMGCYGHSRARELLLGGATRTVLRSMTLPVLLAH